MISGELLQILIDNPGMKITFSYSDNCQGLIYVLSIVDPKYKRFCGLIEKYYYDDVVDCEIEKGIKKLKENLKNDIERGEK